MSKEKKSYWMENQTGNFTLEGKDTFDPAKRYVGIRLQQGVPLLDRDWNELEDIRRYEELMLRQHYIGNGSPDNGFRISAVNPNDPLSADNDNDFKIVKGRCMVNGLEAINDPSFKDYIKKYSDQIGLDTLSPPTKDSREDTVYLDVWIKEVRSRPPDTEPQRVEVDLTLANVGDVDEETCIRHKLIWRVKVDMGSKGNYKTDPEPFHYYYDIARITRMKGENKILDINIQDLRDKRSLDNFTTRSITLKCDSLVSSKWPKLICRRANQATLEGDLHITGRLLGTGSGHQIAGNFSNSGKDIFSTDALWATAENSGKGAAYGLCAIASGTGTGWKCGIASEVEGRGHKSAGHFIANSDEEGEDDNTHALQAEASSSGNGEVYGLKGEASGNGTGWKVGVDSSASGKGTKYAGFFTASSGEGKDNTHALRAYASSLGIGNVYGLLGIASSNGTGMKVGVYGSASGKGTKYAGYFEGNVLVKGTLSKTSGSFLIDHPLDPYNKTLRHSFVESPEDLCLYRGKAKLDSKGWATVKMPEYFPILTKEEEATVTLTPVGKKPFLISFEWDSKFTAFTIFGEPNAEATYIVLANRDDPSIHHFRRPVEEDKGDGNFEKGKLLCPEAYSRPREIGVGYFEEEYRPQGIEPQQIIEEQKKLIEEQKQREEEHRKIMEENRRQKGGASSGK